MNLATTQLKDTYGNLVTTGTTAGSPTEGGLQNGDGQLLTSVGIGTNSTSAKLTLNDAGQQVGIDFKENGTTRAHIEYDGSLPAFKVGSNGSAYLSLRTNNDEKLRIEADGDIAFYDDANNQGLFWDASTARLGLGTQTPDTKLHVFSTSATPAKIITSSITNSALLIGNTSTGVASLILDASNGDASGADYFSILQNNDLTANIYTHTNAGVLTLGSKGTTNAITIDGSNVGIGTDSPAFTNGSGLEVERAGIATLRLQNTSTAKATEIIQDINFEIDTLNSGMDIILDATTDTIFEIANSEIARINSTGLGIGETNPSNKLEVNSGSTQTVSIFKASSTSTATNNGGALIGIRNTNNTNGNMEGLFFQNSNGSGTSGIIGYNVNHTTNEGLMTFGVRNSSGTFGEKMRIDSSGNVGIGTDSPNSIVDIRENVAGGQARLRLFNLDQTNSTAQSALLFLSPDIRANGVEIEAVKENADFSTSSNRDIAMVFKPVLDNTATERMRIDSSGNVLIADTTGSLYDSSSETGINLNASGSVYLAYTSADFPNFNRVGSDGELIRFRKDGTTVGQVGTIAGLLTLGSNNNVALTFTSNSIRPSNNDGSGRDNAIDLGQSGNRFQDIYATNGTIQTSDINEKQDIEELDDAELRVAQKAKTLLRKYRWKSSVEEKGDDARIHFGIIAQDLEQAFADEGLDAGRYGMFIKSTWTNEDGEEQTRLGVRYNQLLAFIISAI